MLTVRDIPAIQGLSDMQIRAGHCFANQSIRWPYIAEEHQLGPWLKGGEVVFITGINRSWSHDDFAQLVQVLKDKKAAALIVLIGSKYIPDLQPSWVDICEENQLTLLEQPYYLPMVTVTERISNAIVQDTFSQRSRQWFFQQLIDSNKPPEAITLERARQIGLPVTSELSVAMILTAQENQQELELWDFVLSEFMVRSHSPFPVIDYQDGWILCLPKSEHHMTGLQLGGWEQLLNELRAHHLVAFIGVSDGESIAQLSRMVWQAKQAALSAREKCLAHVHHYHTLDLQRLFAAIENTELLYDFCRRYLGRCFLSEDHEITIIKQTVASYFTQLCSLRKTAKSLAIHRNTVTHRLNKFTQLTQLALDEPTTRLCVQNALLIEAYLLHQNEQ